MKDIFKETAKKKDKIFPCPICGHGQIKKVWHRRVRRFLKQLLYKEVKEIGDDRKSWK